MRLLITGAWQQAEEVFPQIIELGHEIVFMEQESGELPCDCAWPEGVVCNGLFLNHPIQDFSALRYVQLTSAGLERISMDYCRSHDVEVHNARGVYSIPMAEHAICGVLQLYREARAFRDSQCSHYWEKRRNLKELYGKTVVVIGCGSVGTECAIRFKAFGCTVVGIDATPRIDSSYDAMVDVTELDSWLSRADVVVVAVPLSEQTSGLIDRGRLAQLRQGTVLVNISRGAVVDESALAEALLHNVGGAVLDVFEDEPLAAYSPLWDMSNVLITPHNSFVGDGNQVRLNSVVLDNLRSYIGSQDMKAGVE